MELDVVYHRGRLYRPGLSGDNGLMPKKPAIKKAPSPSRKKRSALIAGASGLVGQYALGSLLASGAYNQVTAVVRKPLAIQHPRLRQVIINYDQIDKAGAALKADDVFCCLGTTRRQAGSEQAFSLVDYDYPMTLARLTLKKGAQQFMVISALGADPRSRLFYNRIKGEMEQDAMALGFKTVCVFRPSLLIGKRKEFRLGEKIGVGLATFLRPLMFGSLKRYRGIEARIVGRAMVKAAQQMQPGRRIYESEQIAALAS